MTVDRADWKLRSAEFGAVREYDDGRPVVAMEYAASDELRAAWLELEQHPHVLDALDSDGDKLLLRYAALYWNHPPIRVHVNRRAREIIAEWGVQLASAYSMIIASTSNVALFARPLVKIDLGGAARLAFLPASDPNAGESAIVQTICATLRTFCTGLESEDATRLRAILDRPSSTFDELAAALRVAGGSAAVRAGEELASWTMTEEALGWLAVRQSMRALDLFEGALELDPHLRVAEAGLSRAFEQLQIVHGSLTGRPVTVTQSYATEGSILVHRWSDALDEGFRLEAKRAFKEALAIYARLPKGVDDAALYTAHARCYLALGDSSRAVDFAQCALAIASSNLEAHAIRARGYLLAHKYDDALKCAAIWITTDPNEATAHYTKGRALFGLHRFFEARDAFDRASALKPAMLEAMLLRREAERAASRVRDDVGTQPPIELDLPEHLAHLRPILASGRLEDAIATLSATEYDNDAAAKLVQARCLAFEKRFDEALSLYDRVSSLAPTLARDAGLAKVDALIALARLDEAVVLLDQLEATNPDTIAVLEARVLTLRQLGRDSEADAMLSKLIAISATGSNLRIRTTKP